jgi:transcriptional regulator with XRE-family HTH domain
MNPMTMHRSVGRRIAACRTGSGLSQARVARRAGLDPSYLSKIERGNVHPTIRTAERVAAALRVSLEKLLGPSPGTDKAGACPVTRSGQCLIDLVDTGTFSERNNLPETYSPFQLRLLASFASVMQSASPTLLKTLDSLLREFSTLQTATTR